MTDLVTFLQARLDEDEQAARAALEPSEMRPYGDERLPPITSEQVPDQVRGYLGGTWGEHFARHDPARVLADVTAKRAILAEHPSQGPIDEHWSWSRQYPWCPRCSDADEGPTYWPCLTVQLLASVYADHPDYRQEWKPDV